MVTYFLLGLILLFCLGSCAALTRLRQEVKELRAELTEYAEDLNKGRDAFSNNSLTQWD